MSSRITGLPYADFAPLFDLPDEALRAHHAVRRIADRRPGFPCRVSLRDADPGETMLLVNFEHLTVASPYRSRYAIYVRQNALDAHLDINEIPEVLRTRLISLRAFDREGMLLDADVLPGTELTPTIERMLRQERVSYLHAHNAKPGCFAARVDRA
jgi:hypothetical protein